MSEYETLQTEHAEHVALIRFNRPEKMNAWNAQVAHELGQALVAARDDDAVRAIVVTGSGKAFCAGADLSGGGETFAGRDADSDPDGASAGRSLENVHPYEIPKPVIAAINGHAVGVGMTWPMLCDIRIVSSTAKLGFVFPRRGMMPELAAHLLVQRVAGLSNAADLLLSGRIFTGDEAARMGIASEALPAEAVLDRAMELARDYVNTAPVSVAITKQLLWEGLHSSLPDMLRREGPLFAWLGNQSDAREGVQSFLERRQPTWNLSAATDLPTGLRNQEGL